MFRKQAGGGGGGGGGTWGSITGTLSSQTDLNTALGLKAPLASPTFTTKILFGNYHVEPSQQAVAASTANTTIDLSLASGAVVTLTHSTTLALSNPQTGAAYVFEIVQGASSYTVAWPGTVTWPGGVAPTISTANGAVDVITLYWNGTSYRGSFLQAYA